MFRKSVYLISFVYLLGLCNNAFSHLVVHWKLDDGQGKIAKDSSGNGHDGVFSTSGAPAWVAGKIGGALQFHGGGECVQYAFGEETWPACTVAVWVKVTTLGQAAYTVVFSNHTPNSSGFQIDVNGGNPGSYRIHPSGLLFGTVKTDWVHLAMTSVGTSVKLYYNGSFVTSGTLTDMLFNKFALAVARSGTSGYLACTIDDLRVYNHALSAAEVQDVMNNVVAVPAAAAEPSPADKATDVPRDAVLGWKPGDFAKTHDVYFGTAFADVNAAGTANPLGVLVGQGQDANTYDPAGLLGFGQIYYWRVDEVNAPPAATIFKGDVWSFTVEPYAYPITKVTATASSAQAGMGPENTVNGSGLNANDQHSTDPTTMWLNTGGQSSWIQYEFDRAYKLHELWVWNSNQVIETLFGLGAKGVTIEYSLDGSTWTVLPGVPEFTKAPGLAGYSHNTVVHLSGILAKYVKLTINSNWGGAPQSGLAEVRFFYVPVQTRAPEPATVATGVSLDTSLNWRPGREGASHQVYLSTDQQAVSDGTVAAQTVTDHSLLPSSLQFGTTYYWRVDEVNDAATPKAWAGDVWSFTTREYAVVEDFETYTDKQGNSVFDIWIDGYTNNTGSVVGLYPNAVNGTFCDTTTFHGGKQSMPFEYNNVKTPYYSETERTLDTPQDWTANGATDLSLWFRGNPVAFVDKGDGAFTISGSGHDIWDNADDFRFACKRLSGDGSVTVKVESLVNTNAWAKAGVMIRDSLEAGSPMAYMIQSFSSGVSFGWRQTANGTCGSATQAGIAAPQWVKLTRKGNAFTAQYSADGKTWTDIKNADGTVTTTTVTMGASVYIGLCVTSHNAAATTTAQFSGAATTGGVTGAWQVAAIGDDPEPANSLETLYVVVQDSAGKSKVINHPDPAATGIANWQQWRIPLSEFAAAGVKLTAVKKLVIGVGDRASPKPDGAGKLYIDDIGFGHSVATK
jgi:regulation of enolase protein 1 (concanavalin A-like superfamily)